MTFSDIFKSSFLESVTEFSAIDTVIGMAFALVIGLFIFVIYKKTFSGVMYSTGFAMSLVGLSLVTTLVIMAVTSNVVLSPFCEFLNLYTKIETSQNGKSLLFGTVYRYKLLSSKMCTFWYDRFFC